MRVSKMKKPDEWQLSFGVLQTQPKTTRAALLEEVTGLDSFTYHRNKQYASQSVVKFAPSRLPDPNS